MIPGALHQQHVAHMDGFIGYTLKDIFVVAAYAKHTQVIFCPELNLFYCLVHYRRCRHHDNLGNTYIIEVKTALVLVFDIVQHLKIIL